MTLLHNAILNDKAVDITIVGGLIDSIMPLDTRPRQPQAAATPSNLLNSTGDPSITLWEGDKIFLRLLLDESTPFFSLKLVYEQDEMTSATLNGKPLS